MSYARGTAVSSDRSKVELEGLLRRYGAQGFVSGWHGRRVLLAFDLMGRRVEMDMLMPDPNDERFCTTPTGRARRSAKVSGEYEAECRRMWRALVLVVKAKLEAVESGISTLEHEFLAWMVLKGGGTVAQRVMPRLAETGELPKLLAAPEGA